MAVFWIWNELEIEPTNDRRAIKRAYAKKSRLCHPEEKPEEFRRLHEAYRLALELAEREARRERAAGGGCEERAGREAGEERKAGGARLESASGKAEEELGERPGAASSVHFPAPDYQQLDELIARGLEQDYARDPELLLEKMKKLHEGVGENVNRYTGQLETCLQQWRCLTDSEHFRTAGWKPEFLEMLSDWLRENRDGINRAEAISLYNAYDFIHYLDRDFPDVPFINEVYIQLMYQARRYERDMLQYSGLSIIGRVKDRSCQERAGKAGIGRRNLLYCLMWAAVFFCLMMAVMLLLPGRTSREAEQVEPFCYSAGHEAGAEHSAGWLEDYGFCRAYPDGYRMSDEEAFSQKITPLLEDFSVVATARLHINGKHDLPNQVELECVRETDGTTPAVYWSRTQDKRGIAYYFTVQPSENGIRPPVVLTSGYLPEVFRYFCGQKQINCRVWYPAYDEVGLAIAWPEVERTVFLEYALATVFEEYSRYAGEAMQPLNITVIYGRDADAALEALAEGTYLPDPDAAHPGYQVSSAGGRNRFQPDQGFEDKLWVSHVVCGPEKRDGTVLYPGCARFDVTKELLDHLESLDWMDKMNYNESNRQTIIKENEQ